MATLRPPFRAEDMDGLYKKVVKGAYPKLPSHFSVDLNNIIKMMLQVNPMHRPDCDKLLGNSAIQKRMTSDKELVLADEMLKEELLQTIRVP
jgi:NIMA (never in mitosis gene a)-related kinase 1/4/5